MNKEIKMSELTQTMLTIGGFDIKRLMIVQKRLGLF